MAIDFSQVKNITIPEGSVKQITGPNGIILWKQEDPVILYENYYLTSYSATKDTNYIDLGIKWNSTYKVEGYYYRPNIDSNWSRILGTGYDTLREIEIDYPTGSGIGSLRALIGNNYNITAYNTSSANTEYGFAVGNRGSQCEFWYYRSGNWYQASSTTWSNNLGISDYNIRLFSATQGDRDGIVGIKSLQINGPDDLWSQANALMYLVPAKKGTQYGMYDKNHSIFYPGIVANGGQFKITDVNGNQIA